MKRLVSMVLVLCMMLTVLPLDVQATVKDEVGDLIASAQSNDEAVLAEPPDGEGRDDAPSLDEETPEIPSDDEFIPDEPEFDEPSDEDFLPDDWYDDGFTNDPFVDFEPLATADTVVYDLGDGATLTFDRSTGTVTKFTGESGKTYDVVIPSEIEGVQVVKIGSSAFYNNQTVVSVVIPEGVTEIGAAAFQYCQALASIAIPDGVTEIGSRAFSGCSALTSVVIPGSVTTIGAEAFYCCLVLTSVIILEGVTTIGSNTFYRCEALTSIEIPDSVITIGNSAFRSCSKLESVRLSAGLTSIPSSIFEGCSNLKQVNIPDGVTSIGSKAFYNCSSLSEIEIPYGVTTIGSSAFLGCKVPTSVVIPNSVTSLGSEAFRSCGKLEYVKLSSNISKIPDSAFSACSALSSIDIPENVTEIGSAAFSGTALTSVEIPDSVVKIGQYVFNGCKSLESVKLSANITEIPNYAFQSCSKLAEITIPEGVTVIGSSAFSAGSALANVNLPDSLLTIGEYAFSSCKGLSEITIPENVTTIGNSAFSGCTSLEAIYLSDSVTSVGTSVFRDCANLKSVRLSANLTSIPYRAFYNCTKLADIVIPDGVTKIGNSAFSQCYRLTEIVLPEGVTSIGDSAFSSCTSLKSINFPSTLKTIGGTAFNGCTALAFDHLDLPYGLETIGSTAFFGCNAIENVTIPASVTKINNQAFNNCNGLVTVVVEDGVTELGFGIFIGCENLVSAIIPDSVTVFGTNMFSRCNSLEYARIPAGLTSIPERTFQNCYNLTDFNIPSGITSIGDYAFYYCESISEFSMPNGVTDLGNYAFSGCSKLESVTLPSGLTRIPVDAFYNCTSLTSIDIPEGVTTIGQAAFRNCQLTVIELPESVQTISSSAFLGNPLKYAFIYNPEAELGGSTIFPSTTIVYGYLGSTAQVYAETYGYEFRDIMTYSGGRLLKVTIQTPDGAKLTDGITLTWYDEDGNVISGENAFTIWAEKGKSYSFEVNLGELAALYVMPERVTIGPDDPDECVLQLEEMAYVELTGKVTDKSGSPIVGAEIAVSMADINDITTVTDNSGAFSISVPKTAAQITVRKDGYYTKKDYFNPEKASGDVYDLGTYALNETVTDRIVLNVIQRQAAAEGEEPIETTPVSLRSFEFTLIDSRGNAVTAYELQGSSLIFEPNVVSAGDRITVTVSDPSGKYADAASVTVTLDSEKTGSAELIMLQKGSFVLNNISGPEAVVMLFDRDGTSISSSAIKVGTSYDPMEAGVYTLVLIQKTNLLRSVPSLDYLDKLGLASGTDYSKKTVTINDGVITKVSDVAVPRLDESKLWYTAADNTSFAVYGSANVSVGTMFILLTEYKIDDSKGVSAQSLQIVLPKGIEVTANRMASVNSQATKYSYDASSRTLTINVSGKDSAVVYLYGVAAGTGIHNVNAYLSLSNGRIQPLGAAKVNVENNRLNAPLVTSMRDIIVSGIAAPKSTVTIYDNDVEVGTTTANAVGSWFANITLVEPTYNYSYHFINAAISSDYYASDIVTDSVLVTYDERAVSTLAKITMYNIAYGNKQQKTVFDYTSSTTRTPSYDIYPGHYPTFTFEAEFESNDGIHDVYIVTEDKNGDKTYIPTVLNKETGLWVGSHDYNVTASEVPTVVYAMYQDDILKTPPDFGDEFFDDLAAAYDEAVDEIIEVIPDLFGDVYSVSEAIDGEDGSVRFIYTDPDSGISEEFGTYSVNVYDIDPSVTEESLISDGYQLVSVDGATCYIIMRFDNNAFSIEYVDIAERKMLVETLQLDNTTSNNGIMTLGWLDDFYDDHYDAIQTAADIDQYFDLMLEFVDQIPMIKKYKNAGLYIAGFTFPRELVKYFGVVQECKIILNGNVEVLQQAVNHNMQLIELTCKNDGKRKLPNDKYIDYYNKLIQLNSEIGQWKLNGMNRINTLWAEWLLRYLMSLGLDQAINKADPSGVKAAKSKLSIYGLKQVLSFNSEYFRKWVNEWYYKTHDELEQMASDIIKDYRECEKDPEEPQESDPSTLRSEPKPTAPIRDPSGYVYEAVPSNRLSGVKAVISSEADGVWDAEDYDQINPQITGEDGAYEWFVPDGNWRVDFTKEGYEPANTENVPQAVDGWLPVPPPQLNINVGMILKASPEVESTVAYTDQAEVKFTQYMNIESVKGAITLIQNGKAVSVRIEPLDAEYDLYEENMYATRFAIIPVSGELSDNIVVSVTGSALNYASKPLKAYKSQSMTAMQRPTSVDSSSVVQVMFHDKTDINVVLQPGISGKTLTVEVLTPEIISASVSSVTTGNGGTATFTVEGKLPGSGLIKVTEPESGLSKIITVKVTLEEVTAPTPVTAYLEDGTVVTTGMKLAAGTKIILKTETEGAEIRYTLNDTCPCEETALRYSEPIVVKGNIVLRAAAYKDGEYSTTIRLELSADPSDFLLGDINGDGEVNVQDGVLMQRILANLESNEEYKARADLNGDGVVNVQDGVKMQRILANLE